MLEVKETPKSKPGTPQVQSKEESHAAKDLSDESQRGLRPSARAMMTANPFALIRRFADEMDRMVEEFGVGHGLHMPFVKARGREILRRAGGLADFDWSPQVDVKERGGQLFVRADLPGLTKDDVKVELTEDTLTIRGERKQEEKGEREGYSYSECVYGSFDRCIPLPEGCDTSKATAEFRSGVLEVAMPLPRRAEAAPRCVEVKEKK